MTRQRARAAASLMDGCRSARFEASGCRPRGCSRQDCRRHGAFIRHSRGTTSARPPAVRHRAGILSPAPSLLNPPRDQSLAGSCLDAQPSGGEGLRLVDFAFVKPGQEACHLCQQVCATAGQFLEPGHGFGGLGLAQVSPACVPPGRAHEAGHDQAVTVRRGPFVRLRVWIIAGEVMIKHRIDCGRPSANAGYDRGVLVCAMPPSGWRPSQACLHPPCQYLPQVISRSAFLKPVH